MAGQCPLPCSRGSLWQPGCCSPGEPPFPNGMTLSANTEAPASVCTSACRRTCGWLCYRGPGWGGFERGGGVLALQPWHPVAELRMADGDPLASPQVFMQELDHKQPEVEAAAKRGRQKRTARPGVEAPSCKGPSGWCLQFLVYSQLLPWARGGAPGGQRATSPCGGTPNRPLSNSARPALRLPEEKLFLGTPGKSSNQAVTLSVDTKLFEQLSHQNAPKTCSV